VELAAAAADALRAQLSAKRSVVLARRGALQQTSVARS